VFAEFNIIEGSVDIGADELRFDVFGTATGTGLDACILIESKLGV